MKAYSNFKAEKASYLQLRKHHADVEKRLENIESNLKVPKDEIDKNTYEIFQLESGVPTYGYDLAQAVKDGYLVDFLSVEPNLKFIDQGIAYDELSEEEKLVYEDTFEDGSKESKMTAMEYVEDLTVDFDGSVKISEHNGVPFVEYIYQGENDEIVKNYKVFCYKGEDGFWMVHFITEIDYSLVYKPYIFEWLETIEAK